ncbi:hypothetical protein ACXWRW_11705, partial [Streptococcus pyogenes]
FYPIGIAYRADALFLPFLSSFFLLFPPPSLFFSFPLPFSLPPSFSPSPSFPFFFSFLFSSFSSPFSFLPLPFFPPLPF